MGLAPAAGGGLGFGAAEAGQAGGGFPLDQRFEGFAQEGGFFGHARVGLGFGDEVVIEGDCGSHVWGAGWEARILASGDADYNACCPRFWDLSQGWQVPLVMPCRTWGAGEPASRYMQRMVVSRTGAERVRRRRDRLRAAGLRPVQIWVPDTRAPGFAAECARQAVRIRKSEALDAGGEAEDWHAASDTSGWRV